MARKPECDLVRTNLWRDHDGAEGARLKKLKLSGKRTELKIACDLHVKGQVFRI